MADKYSTIQQHQPLRIPTGWDKQEKSFVVQLEEILDDIYRRFGRLSMDDMNKSFRVTINGKYDKVSGIDINESGVRISGSRSIDLMADNIWWGYDSTGVRFMVEDPQGSTVYYMKGIISDWSNAYRAAPYPGIFFDDQGIHIGVGTEDVHQNPLAFYFGKLNSSEKGFYAPSVGYNLGSSGLAWNNAYITNIYGTLASSSSREVKHSIFDMKPVGDVLDRLNPVTFIYNNDKEERIQAGLIYEDTIGIMPEICMDNGKEKSINYVGLVPMLLKEIQDLRKRVSALEARNA